MATGTGHLEPDRYGPESGKQGKGHCRMDSCRSERYWAHKLHFSRKPRKGKHAHQGGGPVRRLGGFFLFGLSETSGEAMRIGRKPLGIVYLTRSGTRNGNKVF